MDYPLSYYGSNVSGSGGTSRNCRTAGLFQVKYTTGLLFDNQVVLYGADPLDASGNFTCSVDSRLRIHEAAHQQQNDYDEIDDPLDRKSMIAGL